MSSIGHLKVEVEKLPEGVDPQVVAGMMSRAEAGRPVLVLLAEQRPSGTPRKPMAFATDKRIGNPRCVRDRSTPVDLWCARPDCALRLAWSVECP